MAGWIAVKVMLFSAAFVNLTVASLALAGLLDGPPGAKPKGPPEPLPGQALARFVPQRPGLVTTGGIAVPGLKPGFSFQVWEDHRGKEYVYSKTLLPCDPTDTSGVVYLPKTTLLVQRSPDGKQIVVAEKRAFMVKTDEEVDKRIAAEEAFVAAHQAPPKNLIERVKHWWRKNVTREPFMPYVHDDGHLTINKGEAFLPEAGPMVEIVLAPYFEGADLSGRASGEEGGGETGTDATPTPGPTPIATESLRAPMKILRYLKRYESLVLEDLAPFVDAKRKKPRRRHLTNR